LGGWVTTPPAFFKKDHSVDYQSKKTVNLNKNGMTYTQGEDYGR
jgi:hypothetical protein